MPARTRVVAVFSMPNCIATVSASRARQYVSGLDPVHHQRQRTGAVGAAVDEESRCGPPAAGSRSWGRRPCRCARRGNRASTAASRAPHTQVREEISEQVVEDYAERLGEGAAFPPVVAFSDGSSCWLADGSHRLRAFRRAGRGEVEADVYAGTLDDALWFALGANRAHGARLSRADKKHAVELACVQNLARVESGACRPARWLYPAVRQQDSRAGHN